MAEKASPILNMTKASCPVLQLIGSRDDIVPPLQSQWLQAHLTDLGVENQRQVFDGAGHGLIFEREEEVRDAVIDFLFSHAVIREFESKETDTIHLNHCQST